MTIEEKRKEYQRRLRQFIGATPEQRKKLMEIDRKMWEKRERIKKLRGDNMSQHEAKRLKKKKGPTRKPSLKELGEKAREEDAANARKRRIRIMGLRRKR